MSSLQPTVVFARQPHEIKSIVRSIANDLVLKRHLEITPSEVWAKILHDVDHQVHFAQLAAEEIYGNQKAFDSFAESIGKLLIDAGTVDVKDPWPGHRENPAPAREEFSGPPRLLVAALAFLAGLIVGLLFNPNIIH